MYMLCNGTSIVHKYFFENQKIHIKEDIDILNSQERINCFPKNNNNNKDAYQNLDFSSVHFVLKPFFTTYLASLCQ